MQHLELNSDPSSGRVSRRQGARRPLVRTGLACLIALELIIFDRQLWFARTSLEAQIEPAVGV